jgi:hypothetical protein
MSDSKGDKLRRKGYYEKAANWYEEHGEFNPAGWCWDEIENFQKAFSCYWTAPRNLVQFQ